MSDNITGHDDVMEALGALGMHQPDPVREARMRARCHAALQKRRRRLLSPPPRDWRRSLEPAVVGTLCAVYLFEVLSRAIRLYRF